MAHHQYVATISTRMRAMANREGSTPNDHGARQLRGILRKLTDEEMEACRAP